MLIDEFLPNFDFVETHSIAIDADAATVFKAAKTVDLAESRIVSWLLWLRGMTNEKVTLSRFKDHKFSILGELANKELLIGLAGRFWTPWGDLQDVNAENFREFDRSGYAKAVWNFSLDDENGNSTLTTETRIKCLDDNSRRYFGLYWMFVGPFSGLIRKEMLKIIKQCAESFG